MDQSKEHMGILQTTPRFFGKPDLFMKWNGKLLWGKLKIYNCAWQGDFGSIDIHIPIQLNVPYEPLSETPWLILDVIYNQLCKKQWPVEGRASLYFAYYKDYYHLQIITHKKSTVDFYAQMKAQQELIELDDFLTDI